MHWHRKSPGILTAIIAVALTTLLANSPNAPAQEKAEKATEKPPEKMEKTTGEKKPDDKKVDKKEKAPPPTPIELEPYKVLVNVTVPNGTRINVLTRRTLKVELERVISRTWGGMWKPEVRMNDWICPGGAIVDMQPDVVSERYGRDYDKVMLVAMDPETLDLTATEWDFRSNSVTVPAYRKSFDIAAVPNDIARLLIEVFQPVLLFRRADKFDKSYIEVTLKAGDFPAPDPEAAQIREGDVLRPVVRFFNKRNRDQVDRIQDQTLTYIIVQSVDRDVIGGTMISGVPTVFAKNARRAEKFALRKRPRHKATMVKLVLRSRPDKPLLCHRVNVVSKLKYRDEELAPSENYISDRYGEVEVPVGSYPTYWIYVYSGKLLLARIPYAPGLVDKETVLMPDDSMRLLVEGEVDLLKGRLIDLGARRAVHRSAAKQLAKDGKGEEAKAEFAAFMELPGREDFEKQIVTFEQPAIQKAVAARNLVSRGRIRKVCGEIRRVLDIFFDKERIKQFQDELNNLFETSPTDEDLEAEADLN